MNEQQTQSLLSELDQLFMEYRSEGVSSAMIAGTLLARVGHYYLVDDPADLEGLESLLEYALSSIKGRPRWDI